MQNTDSATADLLLTGTVCTLDHQQTIITNGAVAIKNDTIIAIGSAPELIGRYPQAEKIEEAHGLIMPGLINTHTHGAMSLFRGLADDLPLMQWLQEYIFPVEAQLTGAMVHQGMLLSAAEMIRSGTTSFCDMYLFADEVAAAAKSSGMRGWIGEVLYDFPSPNYGELENGFRYAEEMFVKYKNDPLVTVTVDPHAVYTCSADLLVKLKEMADHHDAPYVIHLSETQDEVAGCRQQYGKTPLHHLNQLGILDQRVIAAHCVVLADDEIELLAERQVKVAHCPESNMKLASGVAPVPRLLKAGVTVGLGTDGAASNNDVDLFREMDSAAKLHKGVNLDPTLMSAEQTLRMATMGGAELLGAAKEIGSLEVGKKADLIVLDLNQPHLTPLYNIPSHLVYAARGSDVIHSVINGQLVMRNRTLTTIDEEALREKIREIAGQIKKISQQ